MKISNSLLYLCAVCFLFSPSLQAEDNEPDSTVSQPKLLITYPAKHDTFSLPRVRIAGCTSPSAQAWINDDSVKVYESGAFVGRVPLRPEMNLVTIRAEDSTGVATDTLFIYRPPPLPVSPESPTEIDIRYLRPSSDVWLLPGDFLEVRFKGSPGGTAKFSVGKLGKSIPMTELSPVEADGMIGIYSGILRIPNIKAMRGSVIEFELRGVDGKRVKVKSRAVVRVLAPDTPCIGETTEETYLWNAASGGTITCSQSQGVRLHIIGQIGEFYKVRLSGNEVGYVNATDVKLLREGTPLPCVFVSSPSIAVNKEWIKLIMHLRTKCPIKVEQSLDPAALELYIYGGRQGPQWTTYPNIDIPVKMITWHQIKEDVLKIRVELDQKQQWGYRVGYEGNNLVLAIRRTPKIAPPPASPVNGLTFALDAGHGGEELGAVGPTGLMEKDVNLIYTKMLAQMLEDSGANVVLTRTEDVQMSMRERMDIAREAGAHIFIWLHNNSVGAASNAAAVRGTSTYFTVPHNQDIAWTMYPHLVEIGLVPFGRVFSSYYVTRQTDMLVFLVEGAFMSHPEDEMLLMDEGFLEKMARAVFEGIEDFLAKQRTK